MTWLILFQTPKEDLNSKLGMDLRRAMLLRLAFKDTQLYPEDPAKREKIYTKYKVGLLCFGPWWFEVLTHFFLSWAFIKVAIGDDAAVHKVNESAAQSLWTVKRSHYIVSPSHSVLAPLPLPPVAVWDPCRGGWVGWPECGRGRGETETTGAQGNCIVSVNKNRCHSVITLPG